jgi:hypothetical protein
MQSTGSVCVATVAGILSMSMAKERNLWLGSDRYVVKARTKEI